MMPTEKESAALGVAESEAINMLLLGEQSTIEKLQKLAKHLINNAQHYEELAQENRKKAEEINDIIVANVNLNNAWETLRWADQKITSLEFMEVAVAEAKSETN